MLLWTADKLCSPSYHHFGESFEGWAYRNGLLRQLHELERLKFLESCAPPVKTKRLIKRLHRLTEKGRIQALEGRDPMQCWNRPWDGHWRIVLYDFPEITAANRQQFRRFLKGHGFGKLQKSVWVTPYPIKMDHPLLNQVNASALDVGLLLNLESMPATKVINRAIVQKAWNFKKINQIYEDHRSILDELPVCHSYDAADFKRMRDWGNRERAAWKDAIMADPLLPDILLPPGYLGKRLWKKRIKVLNQAGEIIRLFPHQA